ncbi:hypothetical protein ACDX66_00905 [Peribacillus frigoritolerans]
MLTERLKRVFSQQASGIDYAILLAPLPVIGYLISLAHQYGELIFYGYPSYFLEIETSLVIKNTIVVIPLCILAFFLAFHLPRLLILNGDTRYPTLGPILIIIGLALAIFGLYYEYVPNEYQNRISNILLLAANSFLSFFFICMFNKRYIIAVCLGILFIATVSIEIGYSSTAYKNYRYIINKSDPTSNNKNDDTYLVVKTYKDNYLTAPINLETKEVSPAFELLKMSKDNGSETIERKKIGIITVKKVHQD